MLLRSHLIAAACAALLASTPVLAQSSSASVEIAGFSYELIDLDLTDSITPALSFTEQLLSSSFYADGSGVFDFDEIDSHGATAMTRPSGAASTSTHAGGSSAEASYASSAPFDFQQFFAQTFQGWEFTLTPATGVLFRSTASLDASHEGDGAYSAASARMAGYLSHFGGNALELSDFTDTVLVDQGQRRYALSGYLHSGQESLHGWVGIQTDATAYAISPAPEPSTWVMLLAGLGLVGRALVRSRSARTDHGSNRELFVSIVD